MPRGFDDIWLLMPLAVGVAMGQNPFLIPSGIALLILKFGLCSEVLIGSFRSSMRWLGIVGFTRAKRGEWKLRSPGSRVLLIGRLSMLMDLSCEVLPERRLEELYDPRMGGLLVPLSLIWVAALLPGQSYTELFWVWSWHGLWAADLLNSSLTLESPSLSFNKLVSRIINMPWKFWLARSYAVEAGRFGSSIPIVKEIRSPTSSLIRVTIFLLEFTCFHFLIVIWFICFGMTFWGCRLLDPF
ncbi:hypothetical protein LINPERHAP1_LOCUS30193 [Linum perenne]